ncbi:uncharacterized protein FIBRA_00642 [Fibroporia radiculosa]|uniref:J domain-containing protein n=1 Tax=Fibroporia radiculosa TaxID=599839 RepID=J4GI88_9APHY|nr:uncharacterized protein FIBRA_00642 [Fibroporia radiculosa]CCL98640.1 predicted protein [Fibroporia radiculosa]
MYHPDVTKDPKSKEMFQAVSEAYAVLGDDRRRRTYDRSLAEASGANHRGATAHHSYYSAQWSYESRRRGATYAWEYARRPGTSHQRPPPGYSQHASGSSTQHPHRHHYDPFASPNVQRATGRRKASQSQDEFTDADRVSSESGFWRVVQVFGIVMVIATVGGGFSANAT